MKLYYLMTLFVSIISPFVVLAINPITSKPTTSSSKSSIINPNNLPAEALLSVSHYRKTCPDAEAIIHRRMRAWINKDPTLAPAIIRLHFHDCAVREAELVPQGRENTKGLIKFFEARGLNMLDLVVLSGAHTIGRSACHAFQHRLGKTPDPSLNVTLLNVVRKKCKTGYSLVDLDATTPKKFDTMYYSNLMNKKGLLSTDQQLYSDQITSPFVSALATQPNLFESQFAVSMIKLGNVQVKTRPRDKGEIRVNCYFVNA
ncbi:hypothetical protein F8388_023287 [Cannabis sativa]|uniref:peroxidase n=2 Tax=Cannabis sativa TaxID=3483 RepID=A0A7J6HDR3_CANSA|nr:hypothetical protein F8388_023287 [Cannabis sativa]